MKKFRRMLCLLLALLTLSVLVPMAAYASEGDPPPEEDVTVPSGSITVKYMEGTKTLKTPTFTISNEAKTFPEEKYITVSKKIYEFVKCQVSGADCSSVTVPAYTEEDADAWKAQWQNSITVYYKAHTHSYSTRYNRTHHWKACACGHISSKTFHVDPAEDADKVCSCGYVFSNNTHLTTLWLTNIRFDTPFNRDVHDYTAKVVNYAYKDVTSTIITAKTFDSLAKLTMPESREIHEGVTKFEFHVLAEDKTTSATYTVTVLKPIKVGWNYIYNDGQTVYTELYARTWNRTAVVDVPEDISAKLLEIASEGGTGLMFKAKFSKWSMLHAELNLPASFIQDMAEKTEADLMLETAYGTTLVIPHGDLAALAEGRETLTIRVSQDNTFAVLAGEESLTLSENVKLNIPETK